MKRLITVIAVIICICSCVGEYNDVSYKHITTTNSEHNFETLRLGVKLENAQEIETKSILEGKDIETRITCITIAAYDCDGLLRDMRHYTANHNNMELKVLKDNPYNIYALVNMGDMTAQLPAKEADLTSLSYKFSSFADVNTTGIPMCGSLKSVINANGIRQIPLERLFAKAFVRILHTGLPSTNPNYVYTYNLCNKSVYLRQANTRLFPFSPHGSRALSSQDTITESDYNADLNNRNEFNGPPSAMGPGPGFVKDTTIILYIPENIQGQLLAGNTNPYDKVPENISSIGGEDYSGICTYLEFNAERKNTGIGYGGGLTYRYYLGENSTSDFSVERNCIYNLTLDFTEDGFFLENWKVIKNSDWKDTRILNFVEDPYIIYKGHTKNVLVHYHISGNQMANSTMKPDDWTHIFDEEALKTAGLTYTIDKKTLVKGSNGYNDFCFSFSATNNAKTGATIPLKIVSWDGGITDFSTITIAELGNISATWDNCPMYVSQEGNLTINGIAGSMLPASAKDYDTNIISVTQTSSNTFKVIAKNVGETELTISNSNGSQKTTLHLNIQAPILKFRKDNIILNPDGTQISIGYTYTDNTGNDLTRTVPGIYKEKLSPILHNAPSWVQSNSSQDNLTIYINKLTDNSGNHIAIGSSLTLYAKASGCPNVTQKALSAFIADPFTGINRTSDFGKIDDYSLFGLSSIPTAIKNHFLSKIKQNTRFEYEAPKPNADLSAIGAEISPVWLNNFSTKCEAYNITWNTSQRFASGASFIIKSSSITEHTNHSAGRHNVILTVSNKHSGEKLRKNCGEIDIYVHCAIGGFADIKTQRGSYKPSPNYGSFAYTYNKLMYRPLLLEMHNYIYFADITIKYITPVSGVLVLSRMEQGTKSRQNIFNCLDIVRPSVKDKDYSNNLLFSVYDNINGDRTIVGNETFGYRRGIGAMLYRSVLIPGKDSPMDNTAQKNLILGYNPYGAPNPAMSPKYNIHDMNISTNMSSNIVASRKEFYFSPTSCRVYTDKYGKGYHVIHFLEDIVPQSNGWINLL